MKIKDVIVNSYPLIQMKQVFKMIKQNSYEIRTCCTNVDVFNAHQAQQQRLDAKG